MDVDDLQLLQADVEGLELAVVPVQGDDLEQPVVQPQADHAALGVHDADDARFRRPADAILQNRDRVQRTFSGQRDKEKPHVVASAVK